MHELDAERLDDAALRVTNDVENVSVGELALSFPVHISDVLEDVGRAVSRRNDVVSGITESSLRLGLGLCAKEVALPICE